MKPTFQNSRQGRRDGAVRPSTPQISNRTDWSFQTPGSNLRGGSKAFRSGVQQTLRPAFHTLSQGFFSAEANRESRFEGALFGVIAALAAWPIALAVQAAMVLTK